MIGEVIRENSEVEKIERSLAFHLTAFILFGGALSALLLPLSLSYFETNLFALFILFFIFIIYSVLSITQNFKLASHLLIFILLFTMLKRLDIGSFYESGAVWLFVFPILTYLLLPRVEALIWGFVTFLSLFIMILMEDSSTFLLFDNSYPILEAVGSMAILWFLLYVYYYLTELRVTILSEERDLLSEVNSGIKQVARSGLKEASKLKNSLNIVAGKNIQLEKSKDVVLELINDIDEEKERLFEQREKLKIILESIGDGVLVIDNKRRVVLINRYAQQVSGYSKNDLVGANFSRILRLAKENSDKIGYIKLISEMFDNGASASIQSSAHLLKSDGEKIPITFTASPIKNHLEKVIGSVIVFRDSTKEKEIDQMKSEFVSIASHQLRTPLASIRWYAELLKGELGEKLSEEQNEFIKSIEEGAGRMLNLVNDLLDVSRIDLGRKFMVEKREEDIVKVIQSSVNQLKDIADQKLIKIVFSKTFPKKLMIGIDNKKISQVFYNLIHNAIKYSPEGSTVSLESAMVGDKKVIFRVKDQGVGIPKNEQDRIFTKFFRAENVSNGKFDGTGLGLYIVKAIVENHGGKISFESKEGDGTMFSVELPLNS